MIDFTRSTKVERETVLNALDCYQRQLTRAARQHDNHSVRNNAQWRLHVVESVREVLVST